MNNAVNNKYVDDQDTLHVLKSGDKMTGNLTGNSSSISGINENVANTRMTDIVI